MKRASRDVADSPRRRWWDAAAYLAVVVCGLAAIGYGFAILIVRTAGFCGLVEQHVERQWGLKVHIGASKATWAGNVVLSDIRLARTIQRGGDAGLFVHRVRLDMHWAGLFRSGIEGVIKEARVQEWRLAFWVDEEGRWQPEELQGVAALLGQWGALAFPVQFDDPPPLARDAGSASAETPAAPTDPRALMGPWKHTRLVMKDGEITWLDAAGNNVASVKGAQFTLTPMDLPTRFAMHCHLQVKEVSTPEADVRNMDVEFLQTGGEYQVLNLSADRHRKARHTSVPMPVPPRAVQAPPEPAPGIRTRRDLPAAALSPEEELRDLQQRVRRQLEDVLRE